MILFTYDEQVINTVFLRTAKKNIMNSPRKKSSNISQSAINGLQAGEKITIGNVSQNIKLSNSPYNHIETIIDNYKENKIRIIKNYNATVKLAVDHSIKKLMDYFDKLEQEFQSFRMDYENEPSIKEKKLQEEYLYKIPKYLSRKIAVYTKLKEYTQKISSKIETLKRRVDSDAENIEIEIIYHFEDIQMLDDQMFDDLKKIYDDCYSIPFDCLNRYYFRQDDFYLNLMSGEAYSPQTFGSDRLTNQQRINSILNWLSHRTMGDVQIIKENYKAIQQVLKEDFEQDIKNSERERDAGIYGNYFLQKLCENGYPLDRENRVYLQRILSDFDLDKSTIDNIEKEVVEPFYEENLDEYKQAYKQKIDAEGFPLSSDSITKLTDLKNSLGLREFYYDHLDVIASEAELIRPFYERDLRKYELEYKQKLEDYGFPLSSNDIATIQNLYISLFDKYPYPFLPEIDSRNIKLLVERPFYHENMKQYGKFFRDKTGLIEVSSIGSDIWCDLKDFQKTLGITDEDSRIIEDLIRENFGVEHFISTDSEVKYFELRELLADREWKKADQKTRSIILKVAGQEKVGKLDEKAIKDFPNKDAYTIDRLWIEYSDGRFGLSVQKKIYDSVNQNKQKFGEEVGWSNKAGFFGGFFAWKSYSELNFSLDAPEGHLPVWGVKDETIFAGDFPHLKLWDNGENDSTSKLESSTTNILLQSFQKIFESINQFEIKNKVDKMGIDGFINQCALLAGATGAASGFGGFTTMIVGVPFDVINNVLQQFRVTLGVIYYKKGVYNVSFAELIKIVGVSIGVEVGATLTKSVMISIANKIIVQLSASTAGKALPFLGSVIGGSVNYGFVKAIGAAVKRIDMNAYTFQAEGSSNELEGQ
ncbi:GUN4 domain-containing protein [uncultured Nostoc sp.]|uniref:GUN4 domain-containing protein n=1 Tax=uncultured Nostoc sp. TaxID=340711 RepID=UPI0035CAEA49